VVASLFCWRAAALPSTIFAMTHFRWADLRLKFGLELSGRWAALFEQNCLMTPKAQGSARKTVSLLRMIFKGEISGISELTAARPKVVQTTYAFLINSSNSQQNQCP
jgi:hypothetical protein